MANARFFSILFASPDGNCMKSLSSDYPYDSLSQVQMKDPVRFQNSSTMSARVAP
jgi:hypothetical protein